jgi:hypothetical protein
MDPYDHKFLFKQRRPDRRVQPEEAWPAMIRMTATAVALILAIATTGPASAAGFGSVTLQSGESRDVPLTGFGGYQQVRVCNDAESISSVSVAIRPRDQHLLQPGLCTENSGDALDLQNRGAGPATIVFKSLCGAADGMMGR